MSDGPILVSSCLAGISCRYDGKAKTDPQILEAVRDGRAIPACAEVLGNLPTPRPPAEIVGGDGNDVLAGTAQVRTIDGEDVTEQFLVGARAVAELVQEQGITHAILQAKSPSCGCDLIYDGSHNGNLVPGDGILAALLKKQGLNVTSRRGGQ